MTSQKAWEMQETNPVLFYRDEMRALEVAVFWFLHARGLIDQEFASKVYVKHKLKSTTCSTFWGSGVAPEKGL